MRTVSLVLALAFAAAFAPAYAETAEEAQACGQLEARLAAHESNQQSDPAQPRRQVMIGMPLGVANAAAPGLAHAQNLSQRAQNDRAMARQIREAAQARQCAFLQAEAAPAP